MGAGDWIAAALVVLAIVLAVRALRKPRSCCGGAQCASCKRCRNAKK